MAYYGKQGNLSTVEAAKEIIMVIAKDLTSERLAVDDYDGRKLKRTIEGLQAVVFLNGGLMPNTWLPEFIDRKKLKCR